MWIYYRRDSVRAGFICRKQGEQERESERVLCIIRHHFCRTMRFSVIWNHFLKFVSLWFLVACYATLHPALSVCQSVGPSVTLYFLGFWPHCSCPNDLVTSITAPAHPHATRVAMYPSLFVPKIDTIEEEIRPYLRKKSLFFLIIWYLNW